MFSDFINNFFERFFGFGLDTEENNQNIHDELKYLIEESSKLSEMDDEGRDLIENVFEFSNTTVKKIMTKRNDISALDIDDELNVIITKIINDGYSRYPVYKDSLDNIIGIVNVKDLFNSYINTPELPILEILRNAVYIIEDELIDNLLKIMKTQKVHLVIVRDEFGGTSGIITMEDILEEIVGEIHDEFDEDKKIFERITDNEIIVEAFIKISDLNKLLKEEIPESELYESLGGYLLQLTGTVPQIGDKIDVGNYSFVIIEGNKRRIQKVKIILKQLLE